MAAVAKKHKTATIFISAHSLEYPSSVIKASDIEVRVLNSQLVCGRHNFESAESIRNKLDYWTTLFHFSKHDKKKQKKQKKKKKNNPHILPINYWNKVKMPLMIKLYQDNRLHQHSVLFHNVKNTIIHIKKLIPSKNIIIIVF